MFECDGSDFLKIVFFFIYFSARSFNISLHNCCIVLRCYITLEKDKDVKKKRNDQTPPTTPVLNTATLNVSNNILNTLARSPSCSLSIERTRFDSTSSIGANSDYLDANLISPMSSLNNGGNYGLQTPTLMSNSNSSAQISSGGAKKVNVEVIMKSNAFRVGKLNFKKRNKT